MVQGHYQPPRECPQIPQGLTLGGTFTPPHNLELAMQLTCTFSGTHVLQNTCTRMNRYSSRLYFPRTCISKNKNMFFTRFLKFLRAGRGPGNETSTAAAEHHLYQATRAKLLN